MNKEKLMQILQGTDFQQLMKKVTTVSLIFTALMLVVYYSFILLLAYGKDFLGQPISEGSATTVGIPIGIGVIIFAWILTGAYVYWANKNYDPEVKRLKEKFQRG